VKEKVDLLAGLPSTLMRPLWRPIICAVNIKAQSHAQEGIHIIRRYPAKPVKYFVLLVRQYAVTNCEYFLQLDYFLCFSVPQ
jgi:hypothetical protein